MVVLLFDMGWVEPSRDRVYWAETFLKWPQPPPLLSLAIRKWSPPRGTHLFPGTFFGTCYRSYQKRLVVTPQGCAASSQHSALDRGADLTVTRATKRAPLCAQHGARALAPATTAVPRAAERTLWLAVIRHSLRPHGATVSDALSGHRSAQSPGSTTACLLKGL